MMTNLYILCGIPASGKSTWVDQHANLVTMSDDTPIDRWISRDAARKMFLEAKFCDISHLTSEQYFSQERAAYKYFITEIQSAILDETKNVFVDATNINAASRNNLYRAIFSKPNIRPDNCYCIAVCFPIDKETAIARDKIRTGFSHVGDKAISYFDKKLRFPFFDIQGNSNELFQWDEILVVTQKNNA